MTVNLQDSNRLFEKLQRLLKEADEAGERRLYDQIEELMQEGISLDNFFSVKKKTEKIANELTAFMDRG